jgi:small subunit ribosomal protein S7
MTRPYSPPRGVGHSPLQSIHSQIEGVRGGGRELTSSFIPVGADARSHPPIASLSDAAASRRDGWRMPPVNVKHSPAWRMPPGTTNAAPIILAKAAGSMESPWTGWMPPRVALVTPQNILLHRASRVARSGLDLEAKGETIQGRVQPVPRISQERSEERTYAPVFLRRYTLSRGQHGSFLLGRGLGPHQIKTPPKGSPGGLTLGWPRLSGNRPKAGDKEAGLSLSRGSLISYLEAAIANVEPSLEIRRKKIAGITRHIPSPVPKARGESLAIRWIVAAAREKARRRGRGLSECLAEELIEAIHKRGEPRQRRDSMHKLAESNRSFVRYRWW